MSSHTDECSNEYPIIEKIQEVQLKIWNVDIRWLSSEEKNFKKYSTKFKETLKPFKFFYMNFRSSSKFMHCASIHTHSFVRPAFGFIKTKSKWTNYCSTFQSSVHHSAIQSRILAEFSQINAKGVNFQFKFNPRVPRYLSRNHFKVGLLKI